eukprot:CAMPEP_0202467796 /NCGR_PEP_ID=MMETSP1360-20130828/73359_1 /ASSEMBLY_ACC=CAM_ASM_000848 /TAXON_ID=515479 /ORGANISM="Licmophora paradoxa, Strain CCMP2313" /LENGTH=630 /DNA_ID=CAMNT_0049092481 /DNA_START=128 /DNA_END=2020 /DNA_ORIENTATION=-
MVFFSCLILTLAFLFTRSASGQAFDLYEAEADAAFSNCRIEHKNKNFSGLGYIDFIGYGAWLEWYIDEDREVHGLEFRYAAGGSERPVDLIIDGRNLASLPLVSTGNWDTWYSVHITIRLSKGAHTIRLHASESTGPNLDWMKVFVETPPTSAPQPMNPQTLQPIYINPTSLAPQMVTTQAPIPPAPIQPPTKFPTPAPITYPTRPPTPAPIPPTPVPILPPTRPPTPSPTPAPLATNYALLEANYPASIVIPSGGKLSRGEFVYSPNGVYSLGLNGSGDLLLRSGNTVLWRADGDGADRCYMQSDGNLLMRKDRRLTWQAHTGNNKGSYLEVDDGGRIAVMLNDTPLWLDGVPRGRYTGPSNPSLQFPVRGAFYYPWYPETWSVNGVDVKYNPVLGKYSNGNPDVQRAHIDALLYARVDVAIASWWGPGEQLDRARIINLMDKSLGTSLKWTVYHEDEKQLDQSVSELRKDLDYLKKWFTWHPTWAHVDGRPVIFVYNENGCEVVDRWMSASRGEWYVVLKLFPRHKDCGMQPDHWHQYGVGTGYLEYEGFSSSVSPGFWRADIGSPRLPRLPPDEWRQNVESMVQSRTPWQLLITFNEWGEGTAVESAEEWKSWTGYGFYLDALHDIY